MTEQEAYVALTMVLEVLGPGPVLLEAQGEAERRELERQHPDRHYFTSAETRAVTRWYVQRGQIWNGMTEQLLRSRYGNTVGHDSRLGWYMDRATWAQR
jgi:hypothetical protein